MATDCDVTTLATARQRAAFRRRLVAWYDRHARVLPWRENRDPYRIWLSEVMLQQTTVAMARPYFERFVAAFPTVHDLAAADEQRILRMWEGLGYYRRARSLHAAAQQVVHEHGGQFPRDVAALMRLPGVGRYTAGAVASFAFDTAAPILEVNTLRVFARLTAYGGDTASASGQKHLWQTAADFVPAKGAGRFNYALMELGAVVCRPGKPRCEACPVTAHCAAFQRGMQDELPRLAAKPAPTAVREAAVVVRRKREVLLRQRGPGERWENMWDFPRFELVGEGPLFVRDELVAKVCEQTGVVVEPGPLLRTIKHGVTRFRITLDCYEARPAGGRVRSSPGRVVRWTPVAELADLPLSVSGRTIASSLHLAANEGSQESPSTRTSPRLRRFRVDREGAKGGGGHQGPTATPS